ncbi:MAG: peptidase M61 [Cytophagaceae bacterium]|nr:peptidase M61 [Cytophagaceae bacterium]
MFKKILFSVLIFLFTSATILAQAKNTYSISFENTAHHEAVVKAHFSNIKTGTVTARMSRSSPGRYALHEFAKNVYGVKVTNSKGEPLTVTRPDPYSWTITGHDGTVNIEYTLFANRGGGTYSQVDDTHAHLNMPATFMFVDGLEYRPIEVTFYPREDLDWKIATQLKHESGNTYSAPDMQYFMDSPTEISDYKLREFELDGKKIRFVLHDDSATPQLVDDYFKNVQEIVKQEKAVYGELPDYDYGQYTFLACYMPNASGDGMEHRNSTILTDTEGLANGGFDNNIGTVAHEYFHSWNVERIRPDDLEPFDFREANMAGELWFAEGFTSYYTTLILERADIYDAEKYAGSLNGTFNYVWNSPARKYFNPIEMSYQAPFVDAATSVDPVNRGNTFISYYSYGSTLGLALDLSLRNLDGNYSLDDFMKMMWEKYGKTEVAYNYKDIEKTLSEYAGEAFAKGFFSRYILASQMPDYATLFKSVGLKLEQDDDAPYLGATFKAKENGLEVSRATQQGSPAYEAGLDEGDVITTIDGKPTTTLEALDAIKGSHEIGDKVKVRYIRFGKEKETEITFGKNPAYTISLDENASRKAIQARELWLKAK